MTSKVNELRGMIYGKFDSESSCASALGWDRQKLNKLTNGKKEPTVTELNELASVLETNVENVAQIFLRKMSPNGQLAKEPA